MLVSMGRVKSPVMVLVLVFFGQCRGCIWVGVLRGNLWLILVVKGGCSWSNV